MASGTICKKCIYFISESTTIVRSNGETTLCNVCAFAIKENETPDYVNGSNVVDNVDSVECKKINMGECKNFVENKEVSLDAFAEMSCVKK